MQSDQFNAKDFGEDEACFIRTVRRGLGYTSFIMWP